jgi:hypothetical protein
VLSSEILEAAPAVKAGYMRLYRGDSTQINRFDSEKTSLFSLFGAGIYLTDNRRVAGDYTTKGGDADVLFRFSSRKLTKQGVLDYWLNKQAAKFDANGVDHSNEMQYWNSNVPFANGGDWSIKTPQTRDEEAKRLGYAQAKWAKLAKTYEIRVKLDGTGVIQKKQQKAAPLISMFDVPIAYCDQCLHADGEVSEDVIDELTWVLQRHQDRGTANDMRAFIKQKESDGEEVTFRDLFTSVTSDSPIRDDAHAQGELREALHGLGYVGIEYSGGLSMGGGYRHRAFVFWDSETVNGYRL